MGRTTKQYMIGIFIYWVVHKIYLFISVGLYSSLKNHNYQ